MAHGLSLSSPGGRGLLAAAVLGSGMAFLDSTAVNVALPPLQRSFEADLSLLQWTVDAYLLFLGALLLVGGALGDRYGRRQVFLIGARILSGTVSAQQAGQAFAAVADAVVRTLHAKVAEIVRASHGQVPGTMGHFAGEPCFFFR